jgi:hypothetical protein
MSCPFPTCRATRAWQDSRRCPYYERSVRNGESRRTSGPMRDDTLITLILSQREGLRRTP